MYLSMYNITHIKTFWLIGVNRVVTCAGTAYGKTALFSIGLHQLFDKENMQKSKADHWS